MTREPIFAKLGDAAMQRMGKIMTDTGKQIYKQVANGPGAFVSRILFGALLGYAVFTLHKTDNRIERTAEMTQRLVTQTEQIHHRIDRLDNRIQYLERRESQSRGGVP